MKMTKMLLLGLSLVLTIGLQAQTEEPVTKETPAAVEAPKRLQPNGERVQDRRAQRDALVDKLNLSEEQTTQFNAINQNYREKTRALRQDNGGDRSAMGKQMRELRQAQREEIRAILTPEQVEIYDAELAANRTSRRAPKSKR